MFPRQAILFSVAVCCGSVLAVADQPAKSPTAADILAKPIDAMDFDRAPLERVLRELAQYADVNIVVDWSALREAKIAGDVPITAHLRSVPFSTVLTSILQQARRRDAALDYEVRDGAIRVSTRAALGQATEIRVYDCRSLLDPKLRRLANRRHMRELVAAICDTVDPTSWREAEYSIRIVASSLVIRQSARNHDAISELLSQLDHANRPSMKLGDS